MTTSNFPVIICIYYNTHRKKHMIIDTAPKDAAVLSNVSAVSEFRIRSTAKSFSILSSGLYSNKIRAIIRELSCNAVDSHTAAGKSSVPFEMHLPTSLEPWFSIRDFGTGLDAGQVTGMYTTYFESTKTESNDYIGALGLGSKSPFSYTDNFTVTAIKDGQQAIYSVFINEHGVPSIACMAQSETTELAGLEIKFSVNDRYDFDKFIREASSVFTHFAVKPNITGVSTFKFEEIKYSSRDIVPGVHYIEGRVRNSVAVMGNIAYPIDMPHNTIPANLEKILGCGLEMHFAIGELDFQASREGLSYIPQTVNAIRIKLEELVGSLSKVLAVEADAIENFWLRAEYLQKQRNKGLWTAAVEKYVTDTKFPLVNANSFHDKGISLPEDELVAKYNIVIRGFVKGYHSASRTIRPEQEYINGVRGSATRLVWTIYPRTSVAFITNSAKTGAFEKSKYHYRNDKSAVGDTIYVVEASNKTLPANFEQFFKDIYSPINVISADTLTVKPKAESVGREKNVTILQLESKEQRYSWRDIDMVWRDAMKLDQFDADTTFYYVPLSGFNFTSMFTNGRLTTIHEIANMLRISNIPQLAKIKIYGVRKGDIETIKGKANWINLETHIAKNLESFVSASKMNLVLNSLDSKQFIRYNSSIAAAVTDKKGVYSTVTSQFKDVATVDIESVTKATNAIIKLSRIYTAKSTFDINTLINKHQTEANTLYTWYPLLKYLPTDHDAAAVAQYINFIDSSN